MVFWDMPMGTQARAHHSPGPCYGSAGPPTSCWDREGSAVLWHSPVTLPSLLAHSIADPQASDTVLRAVEAMLKTYPFDFRGAKILSGEEEGVFGWVTANYLLENFIKVGRG